MMLMDIFFQGRITKKICINSKRTHSMTRYLDGKESSYRLFFDILHKSLSSVRALNWLR